MFFLCTSQIFRKISQNVDQIVEVVDKQRFHDGVIKWKHFPRYWPFVRGIHRSSVDSPHKGQWRGALMFSLICAYTNVWANNRDAVIWDAIALIMTSLYFFVMASSTANHANPSVHYAKVILWSQWHCPQVVTFVVCGARRRATKTADIRRILATVLRLCKHPC